MEPGEPLPVCILCQATITPEIRWRSTVRRGRHLCPRCSPKFSLRGYAIKQRTGEMQGAVLFEGREVATGRRVTLRVFQLQGAPRGDQIADYLRGWEVLREVDHPGVIRLYATVNDPPHAALALEFVSGLSLDRRLRAGPLPLCDALRTVGEVAEALEALHAHGIVHGDVRPSALFEEKGRTKLGRLRGPREPTDLTASRALVDLPGYFGHLPPEQLKRPLEPDFRSDVYSLGALLYPLLTGAPLFMSKLPVEVYANVLKEPPPPLQARCKEPLPRALPALLEQALAKDPADRFQTVAELRQALSAI